MVQQQPCERMPRQSYDVNGRIPVMRNPADPMVKASPSGNPAGRWRGGPIRSRFTMRARRGVPGTVRTTHSRKSRVCDDPSLPNASRESSLTNGHHRDWHRSLKQEQLSRVLRVRLRADPSHCAARVASCFAAYFGQELLSDFEQQRSWGTATRLRDATSRGPMCSRWERRRSWLVVRI